MLRLTNMFSGFAVLAAFTLFAYGTTEFWPQKLYRSQLLTAEVTRVGRGESY